METRFSPVRSPSSYIARNRFSRAVRARFPARFSALARSPRLGAKRRENRKTAVAARTISGPVGRWREKVLITVPSAPDAPPNRADKRSEEHTSELQSRENLV